jgi:hypothetical protein
MYGKIPFAFVLPRLELNIINKQGINITVFIAEITCFVVPD